MDIAYEPFKKYCRVYWGSHGCKFERDHKGDHICSCCTCVEHPQKDIDGGLCTGAPPYYGVVDLATVFYGEDWDGSIPLRFSGGNPKE